MKNDLKITLPVRRHITAGMAAEKLLDILEKYILLDLILMLLGLIHSEGGMRGFPFPWFAGSSSNGRNFLLSLASMAAIVVAGDLITRTVIRISEPVTAVQRTLDQYMSTYSEYEDPVTTEIRQSPSYENKLADDYKKIRSFIEKEAGKNTSSNNNTITVKQLLNGRQSRPEQQKKNPFGSLLTVIFIILFLIFFFMW